MHTGDVVKRQNNKKNLLCGAHWER